MMNQASSRLSDKVTVLVFKDNYAARTFQISLSWINRLGLLLGALLTLTIVSGFLAIKYYRLNILSTTHQVNEFDPVTKMTLSSAPSNGVKTPAVYTNISPVISTPVPTPPQAAPTQAQNLAPPAAMTGVTNTTTAIASHTNSSIYQFSAFSDSNVGSIPSPAELPFAIQTPKLTWKGSTLFVRFALQYIKENQESQQGRIVILARSPTSIRAYPAGVLNLPGKSILISPENGEFFSVSRFREVKANFGPLTGEETISTLEIFIFDTTGKILVYQALTPPVKSKKSSEELPTIPEEES